MQGQHCEAAEVLAKVPTGHVGAQAVAPAGDQAPAAQAAQVAADVAEVEAEKVPAAQSTQVAP